MNKIKIPISSLYTDYKEEIKTIKNKILANFETKMYNLGFELIAKFADYRFGTIQNDIFIMLYNRKLYDVRFSTNQYYIIINGTSFQRFDTINLEKVKLEGKNSVIGYYLDNNFALKINEKDHYLLSLKRDINLTYTDLIRTNKIKKLLNS